MTNFLWSPIGVWSVATATLLLSAFIVSYAGGLRGEQISAYLFGAVCIMVGVVLLPLLWLSGHSAVAMGIIWTVVVPAVGLGLILFVLALLLWDGDSVGPA